MNVKVLWVSEEKKSKKGNPYWSVMVANDDFKSFGIAFRPVDKNEIVTGQFDLTGNKPSFVVADTPF